MTTKVKGKARQPNYAAITTQHEAETAVREIGEQRREVMRIEAEMNDEMARIKERYEQQAKPIKDETADRVEAVQAWAEANRDGLTNGGKKKTAELATGAVSWRERPPKVSVRKADDVIPLLREMGMTRFLRTKTEIDKEAMLKEPVAANGVSGVTVKSGGEDFSIEPFEAEIEDKQ